jgi:hypothetical protein
MTNAASAAARCPGARRWPPPPSRPPRPRRPARRRRSGGGPQPPQDRQLDQRHRHRVSREHQAQAMRADAPGPGGVAGQGGLELAEAQRHQHRQQDPHPPERLVRQHLPEAARRRCGPRRRVGGGGILRRLAQPGQDGDERQVRGGVGQVDGHEHGRAGDADHARRDEGADRDPGVERGVPDREHGRAGSQAGHRCQQRVLRGPGHRHAQAEQGRDEGRGAPLGQRDPGGGVTARAPPAPRPAH